MLTEFLKNLWIKMFGTTEWLGLNIGFWVSMFAVIILVVVMIVVFWSIKPKNAKRKKDGTKNPSDKTIADTAEQ